MQDKDPLVWQQKHSPTEPVEITIRHEGSRRVTRISCHRRIVDARMWERLSLDQQRAAGRIYAGFAIMGRGLGAKGCALKYLPEEPGVETPPERSAEDRSRLEADLIDDYFTWGRACQSEGIDHAAVMQVIGYGYSCRETDSRRRQRNGYTSRHLFDALDLYCRKILRIAPSDNTTP